MSESTVLLGGLLAVNTALLLAVLLRHPRSAPKTPTAPTPTTPHLSLEQQEKLEQTASAAFRQAVDSATAQFGQDLAQTSERLNQLIMRLTTEVVERELEQYHQSLATARTAALDSLTKMQLAIEEHQKSLQGDLDAEVAKRRDYLLQRLDTRLGEAVSAYIVESLGQGADLGAQRGFLIDSLERHKADLKKEFSDGN